MTKIRHKILFPFALSIFANSMPLNGEFRATWVITWEYISPSQNAAQTMARIDEIMDNHAAANMNAVLFQVRQSGTAYYNSSHEPWGYYTGYENPGIDPLQYAIDAAHSRGLELHAWFNVFQASSTYEGAPAQAHPEWICRDRDGDQMTSSRSLSPGLEDVRQYTVDVAMEIVNNYDIDGLHLDYVRWNEHSSGSNNILPPGQIEEIRMMDGIIAEQTLDDLANSRTGRYLYDIEHPYSAGIPDDYSSWEEWWRVGVTSFVSALHDSVQSVKPYVRLSAAVLGRYNWGGWQGYSTVYQDGALWFNEGFVDQLMPMHYHWTSPNSFVQMLTGSNESWLPHIQQGIDEGRLFSAGPGSYVLANQNLWSNHLGIVNAVRNIQFVDGFQFFSNGTWEDYQYWEEARYTFFEDKTIVRNIYEYENNGDLSETPEAFISQISDLEYQVDISTTDQDDSIWTVVALTPSDSTDISPVIEGTYFGSGDMVIPINFDGLQLYEGTYDISIQNFNRYWVGSETIAQVTTETIPSYPPTLLYLNIEQGDTIAANTVLRFEFSKEMDQSSFLSAFSLYPEPDTLVIDWSEHWEDQGKAVSIYFPGLLEFATEYTMAISSDLTDMIGHQFDGDMNGISGDGISITFYTEATDLTGPQVTSIYPLSNYIYNTEGVFNIMFDEMLDTASIDEASMQFQSNGQTLTVDHIEYTLDEITTLSIKPFSPLLNNSNCLITLSSITDTLGNSMPNTLEYSFNTTDFYYSDRIFLDRFNSGAGWWQPDGSGSTTGILGNETQLNYSSHVYVPGLSMNTNDRKSASLHYAWDPDASSSFLRLHNAGNPSDIQLDTSDVIQLYVYSDGSGNQFSISLYEYLNGSLTGDVIEVMAWEELDWTGWRLIEWDLSESDQVGSWLSGDQTMNGDEYYLDGLLLKPGSNSDMVGGVYFDDLRIITKAQGNPPQNFAPIITSIQDTIIEDGSNFYFYVQFSDNNENDIHQIDVTTDTSAVQATIYGHTPGSLINIDYEPFIGTTSISVIVHDFGFGELSDTVQFSLQIQGELLVDENPLPRLFQISNTYPNPFNPVLTIDFEIDRPKNISMHLFDLKGRKIRTIFEDKEFQAGFFQEKWFGKDDKGMQVSNGIYIVQLLSDKKRLKRKITLLK